MFERWENIPLDEFIVFFEGISWRVFSIDEEFNKCFERQYFEDIRNLFAEPNYLNS